MAEDLFVLYVADQTQSAAFYAAMLGREPRLDVPGMTEFDLPGGGDRTESVGRAGLGR